MNVRTIWRLGAILAATLAVSACGGGGDPGASTSLASVDASMKMTSAGRGEPPRVNFEIRTLSNRADLVSDGDVLVEVHAPRTVRMDKVKLLLNGVDITASFVADDASRTFRGLVTGLVVGDNQLVADSPGRGIGRPYATLKITNHPRGGPVLLGSQTMPWICATPTAVPAAGNMPASNASGLAHLRHRRAVQYRHRIQALLSHDDRRLLDRIARSEPAGGAEPANNCFKPYTPGTTPADLATTTTTTGLTVPYIVRVERGTLNRGIYDIAVLFDPTSATPWTALAPQPQWNGKVVYSYGASTGQPRLQFRTEQNWADDSALVARLHGRRQQPDRLPLQLEPHPRRPRRR